MPLLSKFLIRIILECQHKEAQVTEAIIVDVFVEEAQVALDDEIEVDTTVHRTTKQLHHPQ